MKNLIIFTLTLTALASPLQAQSAPDSAAETFGTATRGTLPQNELSTATTVYTRADIERLQVNTLPELLRGTTGVDMVEAGGYGKPVGVFIRGTNADHVLVLIDGIKVGSAVSGTTPFELVPLDQVERVEIVRGAKASLYGSEAIGGVIQIFTRKGGNKNPKFELDAGAGSYDTYRASGTVNGQWQNTWYNLSASQFGSQGFDAQPGVYEDIDRDGYLNTAVNARLGHHFANNAELEAVFLRSEGKSESDNLAQNRNDFVNQVLAVTGSQDLAHNWHSTLRLGYSLDNSKFFSSEGLFTEQFNTTRWNTSWTNQLSFDQHQLIFGSDYRVDEIASNLPFQQHSRYDVGIFTELHSEIAQDQFLNTSVRWDKNEAFGDAVTGGLGWRYNWAHGISFLANFANAFKTPTLGELYSPFFGNPNLKPEQSTHYEAGVEGRHAWGQWQLRGYHTDLTDVIALEPRTAYFQNTGKARLDGVEAELGTQLLGFNAKLSMNLLSPRNREAHARLPNRADKTLAFDLSRSLEAVDLGLKVLAQDYRFDDLLNNAKVGGYVTLDLHAAYHINKSWTLNLKFNNALGNQYQTLDTFNSAQRNFFISVHFTN